jgi:hypothetical protein
MSRAKDAASGARRVRSDGIGWAVAACILGLLFSLAAFVSAAWVWGLVPVRDSAGVERPTWIAEVGAALQGTTGTLVTIASMSFVVASLLFQWTQMRRSDMENRQSRLRADSDRFLDQFLERLDRLERRRDQLRVEDVPAGNLLFPSLVRRVEEDLASEVSPGIDFAKSVVRQWDDDLRPYLAVLINLLDFALRERGRTRLLGDADGEKQVDDAVAVLKATLSAYEWSIVFVRQHGRYGPGEDPIGAGLARHVIAGGILEGVGGLAAPLRGIDYIFAADQAGP